MGYMINIKDEDGNWISIPALKGEPGGALAIDDTTISSLTGWSSTKITTWLASQLGTQSEVTEIISSYGGGST